jgi:hypothetical protein
MTTTLSELVVDNLDSGTITCTDLTINGKDIDQYVQEGNRLSTYFTIDTDANTITLKSPYTLLTASMDGSDGLGTLTATSADIESVSSIENIKTIKAPSTYIQLKGASAQTRINTTSGSSRMSVNQSSNPTGSTLDVNGIFHTNGLRQDYSGASAMVTCTNTTTGATGGTTYVPYTIFSSNVSSSGGWVNTWSGKNDTAGNYATTKFVYSGDGNTGNYIELNCTYSGSKALYLRNDRLSYAGDIECSSTSTTVSYPLTVGSLYKLSPPVMSVLLTTSQTVSATSIKYQSIYTDLDNGTSGTTTFTNSNLGIEYTPSTGIFKYTGSTTRFFRIFVQAFFNNVLEDERSVEIRDSANTAKNLGRTLQGSKLGSCLQCSALWKPSTDGTFDTSAGAATNSSIIYGSGRYTYLTIYMI